MKRVPFAFLSLFFALTMSYAWGNQERTEIIVSAAASLTDAMNELVSVYDASQDRVTVKPTYGSSGALQAQIEQGAPADLFISAAPKQMNALEAEGLLLAGTRKDLLRNSVVLVVSSVYAVPGAGALSSFSDVAGASVTRVALGDFKSVPAGQYAEQVFKKLGILDAVLPKAVFAKDVRQVLAWVESGEVDCGVVYATDAAVSDTLSVAATASEGSHSPVVYPAAVVGSSANPEAAKVFLAWLSGAEARAVFSKHGFTVP